MHFAAAEIPVLQQAWTSLHLTVHHLQGESVALSTCYNFHVVKVEDLVSVSVGNSFQTKGDTELNNSCVGLVFFVCVKPQIYLILGH